MPLSPALCLRRDHFFCLPKRNGRKKRAPLRRRGACGRGIAWGAYTGGVALRAWLLLRYGGGGRSLTAAVSPCRPTGGRDGDVDGLAGRGREDAAR